MVGSIAGRILLGTVVALALAGVLSRWVPVPVAPIVVSGTSMEPRYRTGDLVLVRRERGAYEVGDVVAFRVAVGARGRGGAVIHRIDSIGPDGAYTTKGDNRERADQWPLRSDDVIGSQALHVPGGGRVLMLLREPMVLAITSGLLVVALLAMPPAKRPEDEEELHGAIDEEHDEQAWAEVA